MPSEPADVAARLLEVTRQEILHRLRERDQALLYYLVLLAAIAGLNYTVEGSPRVVDTMLFVPWAAALAAVYVSDHERTIWHLAKYQATELTPHLPYPAFPRMWDGSEASTTARPSLLGFFTPAIHTMYMSLFVLTACIALHLYLSRMHELGKRTDNTRLEMGSVQWFGVALGVALIMYVGRVFWLSRADRLACLAIIRGSQSETPKRA